MPIFSIFPSTSKISTLAQHFNYKRAYFGSTEGRIVHKKFQRFQKWVQMLLKTSIKVVSRHSCQDTSVAISQFSHIRIWWYIAHFDPFNVLIHLHLILWMGKVMHLRANCEWLAEILRHSAFLGWAAEHCRNDSWNVYTQMCTWVLSPTN